MPINQTIEVVIADDNVFLSQALAENLNHSCSINVTRTFDNLKSLIDYIPISTFDVLILDINFNGQSSLDYIEKIKAKRNDFKIIALTTLNNSFTKQIAFEKGIDLFKGKDSAYDNFDQTIINCFNQETCEKAKSKSKSYLIDDMKFTQTKIGVIKGLFEHSGKTEAEIAEILNISTSALKSHKRQLFEMTNTTKIVDLIKYGLNKGILIH